MIYELKEQRLYEFNGSYYIKDQVIGRITKIQMATREEHREFLDQMLNPSEDVPLVRVICNNGGIGEVER